MYDELVCKRTKTEGSHPYRKNHCAFFTWESLRESNKPGNDVLNLKDWKSEKTIFSSLYPH